MSSVHAHRRSSQTLNLDVIIGRRGKRHEIRTLGSISAPLHIPHSVIFAPCSHHHILDSTMTGLASPSWTHVIILFTLLFLLPGTLAQFGNFFQGGFPFQGFQGNEQHHEEQHRPRREHKGWSEMETGKSVFLAKMKAASRGKVTQHQIRTRERHHSERDNS